MSATDLAKLVATAQTRHAELDAQIDDGPIRVGDLVPIGDLEWLLVELEDTHALIVPCDSHAVGHPGDVVLGAADSPTGPLVARCGFARRVAPERLDSLPRTGHVDHLEAVRETLEHAPDSTIDHDRLDHELAWWLEHHVAPAAQALTRAPIHEPAAIATLSRPSPMAQRFWQLAAALFFTVSLVLTGLLLTPTDDDTLTNLPIVWVSVPEIERSGQPLVTTIDDDAEQILLVVETPERFPRYGVRLLDESGAERWQTSDLRVTGLVELVVVLPATTLPPGRHRLELSGTDDDLTVELADIPLEIRAASD
ncbi:MAG: hypothetical protein AAGD38_08285 [Acidobacteriota bacterium]